MGFRRQGLRVLVGGGKERGRDEEDFYPCLCVLAS